MKKITALILTAMIALAVCGCGGNQTAETETAQTQAVTETVETAEETEVAETEGGNDTAGTSSLVIYFSRTGEQYQVGVIDHGNTAYVAEDRKSVV